MRLDFDRRLMLWFRDPVITSDGRLLADCELDDVLVRRGEIGVYFHFLRA